jgi:hypothetical protein
MNEKYEKICKVIGGLTAIGIIYYVGNIENKETNYTSLPTIVMVEHQNSKKGCFPREVFVDHDKNGEFDEYVFVSGGKECLEAKIHLLKKGLNPEVFPRHEITYSNNIPQTFQYLKNN